MFRRIVRPLVRARYFSSSSPIIKRITTRDVRFPTSNTLEGSDSLHTNPNYSCAYVSLETDATNEGHGIIFTIGKGTDVAAKCVQDLAYIVEGSSLKQITDSFPTYLSRLANEPQLRWLGPEKGAVHLAKAGIVNAIWDLWGKEERKPVWKLLCDMSSEQLVSLLDFRYVEDELSPQEALKILKANENSRKERIQKLESEGVPAYTTAVGWSGYREEKVRALAKEYREMGFKHFKVKVGLGLQHDKARCRLMREVIGDEATLMMDANQIWSVKEAIQNMKELSQFNPLWIEQPTAPDDVMGHLKISKAIAPVGVATGEHAHNRILHKHYASMGAYQFCQSDPCRLGGLNELILVMLMAKKFNIPVCLHTGGVGLCEMGVHAAIFDYVAISASQENRYLEYSGALHQHFQDPVEIKNGNYVLPKAHGYASDIKPTSLQKYTYPYGPIWFGRNFTPFRGCMAPPFTQFSPDSKQLESDLTARYARVLSHQGCTGVWVNGSSGEFAAMTAVQRMRVLENWMSTSEVKNGDISVINHVGTNSINQTIELAKHSERLGVMGIAVAAPSYNKPVNQQEIANWIHAVAKQVPSTPVYYYHIPKFNGVQSEVNVALSLARQLSPNVVGVKFTDSRFDDLGLTKREGFNVLVGGDTILGSALAAGADGVIGIGVNFMGRSFRTIYDLMLEGKVKEADDIQQGTREVFQYLNKYGFLQVGKWLMDPVWGLDMGPPRLPFTPLSDERKQFLLKTVVETHFRT